MHMNLLGHAIDAEATGRPFLIAGPCVIESEGLCLSVAQALRRLADRTGALVIFTAGFDNTRFDGTDRSTLAGQRGPGLEQGLRVLEKVRAEIGLPVMADVHDAGQVAAVAQVADMLQTPAFLARQTDLIVAAAASGRPVNLMKAPFMAPADMAHVVGKARRAARAAGHADNAFTVCEQGTMLGYDNLVVDMRSLMQLRDTGCPVVFDATHGAQLPGGQREFVAPLARAAVAVGVAGLFLKTHPDPDHALSNGSGAVPLAQMPALAEALLRLADCAALIAAPSHEPLFAWRRRSPSVVG